MEITSHATGPVELAARLVNAFTPGHAGGRAVSAPVGDDRRSAVVDELADRPNRARVWAEVDDDELHALATLAGRWRRVFETAEEDPAGTAPLVNALLGDAPVAPVLVDHDDEPWHLHAHADDAAPADGLAAIVAIALARSVAAGGADRLGVCGAAACDRVFVDTSRNGSRRYCSSACQARTKTAAFRARRR